MMEQIRVGLVGFGTAGSIFHAPLLQSNTNYVITHVVERSTTKSLKLNPTPIIVKSMNELLETNIDLVVIATPTVEHYEQAKASMNAKKHVVVDKPVCITEEQLTDLIACATENHVIFSVFQNRRWDSDFQTVQKLIKSGELGDILYYEAHFDRYRPNLKGYWKEKDIPGSGVLYDLGAHLVDQALQLFGPPENVNATVEIQRPGAASDDYFKIELTYGLRLPNLKVVLTAGCLVQELGPRYYVVGTEGTFAKTGDDVQESQLREGKVPGDHGWGHEPALSHGMYISTANKRKEIPSEVGAYEVFYENIASVIRGDANVKLLVDPKDLVDQIRILENAKKLQQIAYD